LNFCNIYSLAINNRQLSEASYTYDGAKGELAHGSGERIVNLLRRSPLTVNDIAARLGLTHNALRSHLPALQREGLIRPGSL
jgi:DNA-binding transcriptional ArsR family regulator